MRKDNRDFMALAVSAILAAIGLVVACDPPPLHGQTPSPLQIRVRSGYPNTTTGYEIYVALQTDSVRNAQLFLAAQTGPRDTYELEVEAYGQTAAMAVINLTSPIRSQYPTAEFKFEIEWGSAAPTYELTLTVKSQAEAVALLDLLQANIGQFPGAE